MSETYDELVDELESLILDIQKEAGGIDFPEIDLQENIVSLRLGVYWIPACETFPQGTYLCSDEASHELLKLAAEGHLGAWNLCEKVAIHRLATHDYLPEGARAFLTMSHTNQIHRPKTPRRNRTWLRAQFIYLLINLGHLKAGLVRTRGEYSKPPHHSACDAAVEALGRVGYHIGYRSALEICSGSKPENVSIRNEHWEWSEAVKTAKRRDPLASFAFPGLGGVGLRSPYWKSRWENVAE